MDDSGTATRERLLSAAVEACVSSGYEGTTLGDIARRAGVSAPAVYNHFRGKEELLVEAGRWSLDRLSTVAPRPVDAGSMVRAFLSVDFASTRRLLAELHLAGQRRPEVAELLATWHRDHAAIWAARAASDSAPADVTTYFALLLGLCHIEALGSLGAPVDEVAVRAASFADSLFTTNAEERPR